MTIQPYRRKQSISLLTPALVDFSDCFVRRYFKIKLKPGPMPQNGRSRMLLGDRDSFFMRIRGEVHVYRHPYHNIAPNRFIYIDIRHSECYILHVGHGRSLSSKGNTCRIVATFPLRRGR